MHTLFFEYILIDKTRRKSNYILIGLLILYHVSHLFFNFVPSELLSVKIEESKSNLVLNLILIGVQFSATCPFEFLNSVTSELLVTKTKESKTN